VYIATNCKLYLYNNHVPSTLLEAACYTVQQNCVLASHMELDKTFRGTGGLHSAINSAITVSKWNQLGKTRQVYFIIFIFHFFLSVFLFLLEKPCMSTFIIKPQLKICMKNVCISNLEMLWQNCRYILLISWCQTLHILDKLRSGDHRICELEQSEWRVYLVFDNFTSCVQWKAVHSQTVGFF